MLDSRGVVMHNKQQIIDILNTEDFYIDNFILDAFIKNWKIEPIYEDAQGVEFFDDMAIEKVTLAEEVIINNAEVNKEIEQKLIEPAFEYVSHEQFKEHTKKAKAIIRTGEATPYANVILHAGVIF